MSDCIAVTPEERVFFYEQPGNGVLDPALFTTTKLPTTLEIGDEEFTSSLLISIASVYLFRFIKLEAEPEVIFKLALKIANTYSDDPEIDYTENWRHNSKVLLSYVRGLDDDSIVSTVRLAGFNSYYSDVDAGIESVNVGAKSMNDIRDLFERICDFSDLVGLVNDASELDFSKVRADCVFINVVDRHFVAGDTFWHIKAFRPGEGLNKVETLELLVFYLFGLRSDKNKELFKDIKKLGIFDARTNTTFVINVSDIPKSAIDEASQKVIGFK
ncbi:hypothetical protein [Candidatus Mycoplasma haematohominis]|uniref:Uncharacterized protein n=1 Tax=Candidatus Mycoplasma haematohominis TaxID=1494318 RepID=A0A478FQS9_9MOLU|nr:hypothetical protein [Candidatus Mycoplasma haemohominis]GCE63871.1 hypothetical protein MHSWG343_08780 [Candidatus Mycoplasma haemohominis]